HFNGELAIGAADTTMQSLASDPLPTIIAGRWRLTIAEGMLENGTPYTGGPPASNFISVDRNDTTGASTLVFGSVAVTPPTGPIDVNGWEVHLGPVLLDGNGLYAQHFRLTLPEDSGWRLDDADPATSQLLNPVFASDVALPLTSDLQ